MAVYIYYYQYNLYNYVRFMYIYPVSSIHTQVLKDNLIRARQLVSMWKFIIIIIIIIII
jgi:hypothetical protein